MDIEKSVNFEMLRSRWPELATLGARAESYVHSDPESCLVKLRDYLELIVRWLYRHERLEQGCRASSRPKTKSFRRPQNSWTEKFD